MLPLLPAKDPGRLVNLGSGPEGFLRVLASWRNVLDIALTREEYLQDYFALCVSCHHATVATFVPTDVDSKIRGLLWREVRDPEVLRPMLRFALEARKWSTDAISRRVVRGVSGHDGEHWSILAGALGRFLELGDDKSAEEAKAAIDLEIDREEAILNSVAGEPGAEIELLQVVMSVAHNRGDLQQGMSFWSKNVATNPVIEDLSQRGRFARAIRVYQDTGISAEGHRHYPLRPVKALRESAETLLPLAPFLDDWGARIMQMEARAEVLEALVLGCHKIEGQQGYYRALAGMRETDSRGFDLATRQMSNSAQRLLKDAGLRKKMDTPRQSFESGMRKRARAAWLGA
ncbi:MAG: hypothetical protein H7039_21570 [Bryobacteraceae bacterium]|nr:hypothetical protein [Bryobacteraceae bacterium]